VPYSFADEPEDYTRPKTNNKPEPPEGCKLAQEFIFEESVYPNHTDVLWIMVDEDSSREEVLREQENWEDALEGWSPPKSYRKAVWEILAYLDELLEASS